MTQNRPNLNDLPLDHELIIEYDRFIADVWQDAQIANGFDPEAISFYDGAEEAFWSYRETGYI